MRNTEKSSNTNSSMHLIAIISILITAIFILSLYIQVKERVSDLNVIITQGASIEFILILGSLLAVLILLPLIFTIGIFFRKNWARFGMMVFAFINIISNVQYIYSMRSFKSFYFMPLLWILFYSVISLLLFKYKTYFHRY